MRLKFVLALAASLLICMGAPTKSYADVNDFVITNFHGSYDISNDLNGGSMSVNERIDVTFSDQNHGILRALPQSYQGNSLDLDIASVQRNGGTETYSTYEENDNLVLRIGDPGKTVTGEQSYEISYKVDNVITFYESYDEWYWDINGDQWKQPFLEVSGEVRLPSGWQSEDTPSPSCYTGRFKSHGSSCVIELVETGYTFRAQSSLSAEETLTVAIPFNKGLFMPVTLGDWLRGNILQFVGIFAGFGLSFMAYRQWKNYGKDYKGKGVIVPHYKPPKDLTPAEVGLLMDYRVDGRDLSATIIDLAVRSHLKIHDNEKKTLGIFKRHEFTLELTHANTKELKQHEIDLLTAIFGNLKAGKTKNLDKLDKHRAARKFDDIKRNLRSKLKDEFGLIDKTPLKAMSQLAIIALFAIVVILFIRPGWGWTVGMAIAILSVIIAGLLMRRRTHAGVEAYEHVKGLKWYMETAEKDRLKMMQSVERKYAEPSKTAHLFEKLLPYAVALGVEKSWAREFDGIYDKAPEWYAGNYAAFSTARLASGIAESASSFNSSFSQSTSSSSSGSGGGGFAGGGGGGGGGGGW